MLYNSTHLHVASTAQGMLQSVGLSSIQLGPFSVLFLCIESLRKVLEVVDSGESKKSSS
jgi:hypothetical protein